MKEIYDDVNSMEDVEAINAIKYYYFGKAYFIANSKKSLKDKKKLLDDIISELDEDVLLQNPALSATKKSIKDIIYCKIDDVNYYLDLKKSNKRLNFFFFNLFSRSK